MIKYFKKTGAIDDTLMMDAKLLCSWFRWLNFCLAEKEEFICSIIKIIKIIKIEIT